MRRKNVQGCVSQESDPTNFILRKVEELGLNASAGHTMKFLGCIWYELSKKANLMSEILARSVLRNEHLRKPQDKQIVTVK